MRRIVALGVPVTWLLLFLGAPLGIIVMIAVAFSTDGVPPYRLGFNPEPLTLVLTDAYYRDALGLSLRVASVATLACLLIGYPMALAIARADAAWRDALLLGVMLPFWAGFLIRINAWIGILGDAGPINAALGFVGLGPVPILYMETAMYIGIVYTYLPFMVLPLYAMLSRLELVLEEAAADLGARPVVVFARITLPLSLPGVVAGCALVFVPAVGEYVIPELLGGPDAALIGRVLWGEFFGNRDWPVAAALAVGLLAVLLGVPWVAVWVGRRVWGWRVGANGPG